MRAFNQIPSGSEKFFNFPKIVGDTFCQLNHHFRGLRSISDLFVEETASEITINLTLFLKSNQLFLISLLNERGNYKDQSKKSLSEVRREPSNSNQTCLGMYPRSCRYNNCSWQPITVGGAFIERVSCFKLLGAYISEDLSWASHCDLIIKRANRRLHALRELKNCSLPMQDLLAVYCLLIRYILEYASIVFANLPQYLFNALENIQKSALGIIVPCMSYSQALHLTGLPSLQGCRESACIRFISKISPGNPLYALISSRSLSRESPYNLRMNTNIVTKQTNTDHFAQFVTCKYATYLDSEEP